MPKSKNRRKRRRRHKRVQRRGFRVQIGANLLPIVNARKHDELKIQTDMLTFYYENRPRSFRWCSDRRGVLNGAKHYVSNSTLQEWVAHYEKFGEPPIITKRYMPRGGNKSLNTEQQNMLKKLALENPECYLDELQELMIAKKMTMKCFVAYHRYYYCHYYYFEVQI